MELNPPPAPSRSDPRQLARVSRAIVAHNPVGPADDPSTSDVLAQVELVAAALAELGIAVTRLPIAGWRIWEDLAGLGLAGGAGDPGTVVFNLVEAPPGMPGVHPATAAALELLGLPFSGSSAASLWLSTDKLATRAVLAANGLPVAAGGRLEACTMPGGGSGFGGIAGTGGFGGAAGTGGFSGAEIFDLVPGPWILKPACEDASLGLDGDAVCATREAALARAAELANRFPGQPLVVERYLPGRELNVSLLADPDQDLPQALPVAEIEFVDYPAGMPRIVGYEAKWQPESFAYTHTVRCFPPEIEAGGAALLAEARRLAVAAWRACGLSGYGRVDLRLDEHGAPHVLEVNANPCLAADAGFMAAAEQAGLTAVEVIARIVAVAVARHDGLAAPSRPAALAPQPATVVTLPAAGLPGRRAARRLRVVG